MAERAGALLGLIFLGCVSSGEAMHGLRATGAAALAELLEGQLQSEFMSALGQGDSSSAERLDRLQADMEPMFRALPKNEAGGLDHGPARYALHRFFVQQHGWHVRGLEASGAEKWGDASPTAMLENRIPDHVLQLVQEHLAGKLGLQELAVLAAMLEDLVHSEAIQLVAAAFAAQNVSVYAQMPPDQEELILKTFLLFHIKPNPNYTKMSTSRINHIISKASKFLYGWEDTLLWVNDLQNFMEHQERSHQSPFQRAEVNRRDFDSVVRLVEDIGEGYGQFQNLECQGLKTALVEIEEGETGRVRLSKFYSAALSAGQAEISAHFSESADYLRHLGVLDETDSQDPSVIVPNYLYAKSNCLASSSFYSVCCIDECETLLAHLERSIAGPRADPQLLVELVAAMHSDTVAAPRNLSAPLRRRLDGIAEQHGGGIPIHGRLFLQWMHHAFPNECPYPHAPGTSAAPLTPLEFKRGELHTQRSARASKDDMLSMVEVALQARAAEANNNLVQEVLLPWTEEEELVALLTPATSATRWSAVNLGLRLVVLALALSSAVLGLIRLLKTPLGTLPLHNGKAGQCAVWSWSRSGTVKSHLV